MTSYLFFIAEWFPSTSSHVNPLDFDIRPGTCVVIQVLRSISDNKKYFSDRINALPNHHLYREDTIFLHPRPFKALYVLLSLRYYQGYLLESPIQTCFGRKCRMDKEIFLVNNDDEFNINVTYLKPQEPVQITTKGVSYPTGKAKDSHFFSSYENVFYEYYDDLKQWLSSSVYHINCSKPVEDIANWSHLSVEIISAVCEPKTSEHTHNLGKFQTLKLRPPRRKDFSTFTHLKTLIISFHGLQKHLQSIKIGTIIFQTDPVYKMCVQLKNETSPVGRLWKSCATLRTEMTIFKLPGEQNGNYKIGLQIFQETTICFVSSNELVSSKNISASINYKWVDHKKKPIIWTQYHKTLKLMSFSRTEHSWMSAAQICAEHGMTLPHLKDKASTWQLVLYVLEKYALPTYALFVGLIRKVSIILKKAGSLAQW